MCEQGEGSQFCEEFEKKKRKSLTGKGNIILLRILGYFKKSLQFPDSVQENKTVVCLCVDE